MTDQRRQVERMIETDPVIKKGLQRGIINVRALARFILEIEGIDSTPDAILGIIRRYPVSDGKASGVDQVLGQCGLSLRNKIADIEVEHNQDTMNRILQFASTLKSSKPENIKLSMELVVVGGLWFIRLVSDQRAIEEFVKILQPEEIRRYSTDLAEVSLHLPPGCHDTRGMTAKLTTELLLNDIDLVGVTAFYQHHSNGRFVSSRDEIVRELILTVAEADGPRALEVFQRMLKEYAAKSRKKVPQVQGQAPRSLITEPNVENGPGFPLRARINRA
jgi:hypothetical protein